MKARSFRREKSGQVLVITSLVVVMLLLSTVVYVTETQKNAPVFVADQNAGLAAIRQAAVHTLVSALANVSNGGDPGVLAEDLTRFKAAVEGYSLDAISKLDFTSSNSVPYVDGSWISWGTNGESFSGMSANFALNCSGNSASYYSEFSVTVTSSTIANGTYALLNESTSQVTVTCTLLDEGKPAATGSLLFYYQQETPATWTHAMVPTTFDYGNGTTQTTFYAQNATQTNPLPISVHCVDARGISVWANTTCTQR